MRYSGVSGSGLRRGTGHGVVSGGYWPRGETAGGGAGEGGAPAVVRRDPRAEEEAALVAPLALGLVVGDRPVAAAVVYLVVVEEVEHAGRHDELGTELHADGLDGVERSDLIRCRLLRVLEELRVLDVRRADLRGELARRGGADDRQGEVALLALPDAVDGLGEGLGELRRALEDRVEHGGRRAHARRATCRRGAERHERDHVAAVGVQTEMVVGLLAALGRRRRQEAADARQRVDAELGGGRPGAARRLKSGKVSRGKSMLESISEISAGSEASTG